MILLVEVATYPDPSPVPNRPIPRLARNQARAAVLDTCSIDDPCTWVACNYMCLSDMNAPIQPD
jgi:hypothetical protein